MTPAIAITSRRACNAAKLQGDMLTGQKPPHQPQAAPEIQAPAQPEAAEDQEAHQRIFRIYMRAETREAEVLPVTILASR